MSVSTLSVNFAAKVMKDQITYGGCKGIYENLSKSRTNSWTAEALDQFLGTKSMVLLLKQSQEEQNCEV